MVRARACESTALTPAPASAEFLSSLPFSSLGGSSSSSRERPPAAVPAGPEARRGAGRGVAGPRACGAATWAGSRPGPPPPPREPQGRRGAGRGRDGLQTPSPGGAARSASTLGPGAAR